MFVIEYFVRVGIAGVPKIAQVVVVVVGRRNGHLVDEFGVGQELSLLFDLFDKRDRGIECFGAARLDLISLHERDNEKPHP